MKGNNKNMKRKILVFTAVLFLFAFVLGGCGPAEVEFGEEQAEGASAKYIQNLIDGDFDRILENCDRQIKAQTDRESLKKAWSEITGVAGDYNGTLSTEYSARGQNHNVLCTLDFSQYPVTVNFIFDRDGKISGIWFNYGQRQEGPQDTESYTEKEIKVGEWELEGIVTIPKGVDSFPVAVLVPGSGPCDYDESVGLNKPFRDIAHSLAEKGIATLRFNKRYYQLSDLADENVTIYTEYLDDTSRAVKIARQKAARAMGCGENDVSLFIIGHSLGAMSGPKIALDNSADGLVMLRGSLRGLEDILYDQSMAQVRVSDEYDEKEKQGIEDAFKEGAQRVKDLKSADEDPVLGMPACYWLSLRDLQPEAILKEKLSIPILALQGESDIQVYYDKDFLPMKKALSGRDNITFKSYPGLNHLFMPRSDSGSSGYFTPSEVSEEVTNDIAAFILDNFT